MKHTLREANKILGTNFRTWEQFWWHAELNDDFIREWQDMITDWDFVTLKQARNMSEDFMREFDDRINFDCLSCGNNLLSEKFLLDYKKKLTWWRIVRNYDKEHVSFETWLKLKPYVNDDWDIILDKFGMIDHDKIKQQLREELKKEIKFLDETLKNIDRAFENNVITEKTFNELSNTINNRINEDNNVFISMEE